MLALLTLGLVHALDPILDGEAIGPLVQVQEAFTSLYVLGHGDGTVTLFDTGTTPQGFALRAALASAGLTPAAVTDVFLTHGHGDHIAALGAVPDARVHALAAEVPLVADAGFAVTHPRTDGDVVTVGGGWTVEVFAVPGHTAGTAVYLVGGVLVAGDTVFADGGALEPIWPVFSDDPAQNVASLQALRARLAPRAAEILWIAPSHSAPVPGPGAP